jgi:hypothetical protein
MEKSKKYPVNWFVYYRDNFGDMIIAQIRQRSRACLTVLPRWYAAEPAVHLPLREFTGTTEMLRIPHEIVERVEAHAPV